MQKWSAMAMRVSHREVRPEFGVASVAAPFVAPEICEVQGSESVRASSEAVQQFTFCVYTFSALELVRLL